MIWPFRKRPPKVVDRRHMNEDWCVGDLAECISDDFHPADSLDPKTGDVLRVTGVSDVLHRQNLRFFALRFEGKPQEWSWECTAFRKLRPVQTAADQSFSAWLRDSLRRPQDVRRPAPDKEPAT